ncbi:MAG: hypothetical protein M1812_000659 [Candelaria pacifica]|nr:MAG: hypothetical protein M1812_000659 [Candelaria pacifica]
MLRDEEEFPRKEKVYHPADEWPRSWGEYHPADLTRNASLSRFPRSTTNAAAHRPSPLRVVTSSLDISDPVKSRPSSPDTPAPSPRILNGTPAFRNLLNSRWSDDLEDEEEEEEEDKSNVLDHYEDEDEDEDEDEWNENEDEDGDNENDEADASPGRDNPFPPSENLNDRSGFSHVPSVLPVIYEEEEVPDDYTIESPLTSPTSDVGPLSPGYSDVDEATSELPLLSKVDSISRVDSISPVSPSFPAGDSPRSPVSPLALNADSSDSRFALFPIPPISPALKLQQGRHAVVSFNKSLRTVLKDGVQNLTRGALRDVIEPAAWELTADQMIKALREHLPSVAKLEKKCLLLSVAYQQSSIAFDKLRQQMCELVGGADVLEKIEDLRLQLEDSQAENAYATRQLTDERLALNSRHEDCTEHLDELRYLQLELNDAKLELKTLKRQNEVATTRRDAFLEQLDSLEIEEFNEQRAEVLTALVSSRDELKLLRKQADFKGTELALLKEELEDTKEGLAEARKANEAKAEMESILLTELENTKRQVGVARYNERAAIERTDALNTLTDETITNMGIVDTHVRQTENELEETKRLLVECKQREGEALKKNETLQEVLDGTSSNLAETKDKLAEVTEILARERRADQEDLDNFSEQLETMRLLSQGGMV